MDPTLPIGISFGIGALAYVVYLVRGATQEFHEYKEIQHLPLLLPEQAASAHQPKPNIAVRFSQAWREVSEEKKIKELPPLEKVHYTAPAEEEEEEWLLKYDEPEGEETLNQNEPLAQPAESIQSNVPIDQLETHSKKAYYNAVADITDKVAIHFKKHGKITRDGMVPSSISRKEWDHICRQPDGVLWISGALETRDGATVLLDDCDEWVHLWFRERGYRFIDNIYSEDE